MKLRFLLMFATILFACSAYAGDAVIINQNHIFLTLLGFFGVGFLLAFTPCVLPMVPILSAILIGQKKLNAMQSFKLSFVFVLSMALTYAAAGMVVGYLGSTVQTIMQAPWIIISFSLLFVVMALSMFGLFDLALPRVLQNQINKLSQRQQGGSYSGVALMGVLSTLIASPCITPPLVSVLTYIGQTGNSLLGSLILFVLALGMGMPLILFGMGQGAILPKAGVWMNNIKRLFGMMMLGLSIWMVSRLLPDNMVIYLWSSWLILGAALFGALNLRNEKKQPIIQGLSVFALIYGVMLMVGAVTGRDSIVLPLQPWVNANAERGTVNSGSLFTTVTTLSELNRKLANARTAHKPAVVEFYASWCSVCRTFDRNVLSYESVQKRMRQFAAIRVDVTEQSEESDALLRNFGVYGTPTFIFYDKNGNELTGEGFAGSVSKSSFEQSLDRVYNAG